MNAGGSAGPPSSNEFSTLLSSDAESSASFEASPRSDSAKRSSLSYFAVLLCVVLLSVDYSVIMPSLWLFMQSIDPGVNEALLGVALAAFQLGSLALAPLFGWWLDRRPMKEVMVTQLWISIVGNVMYSCSGSIPFLIVSRAVCGAGSTVALCGNLYVIRTSEAEGRSSAFAALQGSMLVGLLIGPAFNYPLTRLPVVDVVGLTVNSLNAVGILMAALLGLAVVLVHAVFREPPEVAAPETAAAAPSCRSITTVGTVALMGMSFVSSMNQVSLEMALPPITLALWNFGQLQNSIVYTVLVAYLLIWYVILSLWLAYRLSDRVRMLIAWMFVGAGVLFLVLAYFAGSRQWHFWEFAVGAATVATSIPFFDSATGALLSKMVPDPSLQGRAQSVKSSVCGVGILIGPLIAAPVLQIAPVYLFVMVGGIFAASFPCFLLSFRFLVPSETVLRDVN